MKSVYRLRKNHQYSYVYKHAKSVANMHFVLLYCKGRSITKFGFSISKKYGKAVKRNRLRRQLKAAASMLIPKIANGFSVIVIPRNDKAFEFATIVQSLEYLLDKAGLML